MDPTPAATGMDAVVSALTTGLTPAVFFDTVADIIPFVVCANSSFVLFYSAA